VLKITYGCMSPNIAIVAMAILPFGLPPTDESRSVDERAVV